MAATGLSPALPLVRLSAPRRLQLGTLLVLAACWEILSASGLFYRGVVPSLTAIAASLYWMLGDPRFWLNLSVTVSEIGLAIVIGGGLGVAAGTVLGANRFLGAAFGPYVIYLGSTPKVILLPIVYLMVGIGPESKVVIGAIACFMPMAISTAAGVRQINPVLIRVGRSFRLTKGQILAKIVLPAMRTPVANGLRLALGSAIVVCLVAEIKFSRLGLGQMIIQSFNRSRFADVYAGLVVITTLALVGNMLVTRLAQGPGSIGENRSRARGGRGESDPRHYVEFRPQ
jgi:ABC-type nitrate/sulfonate/bicarbonate transport system permease component